jgi:hypothetical protein
MANILLAAFIIVIAAAWRSSGYWTPWPQLTSAARRRLLLIAGAFTALLTTGFSLGDVLGGRTQISKDPVRYASRLHGADAHHHDLLDSTRYWEQILVQTGVGLIVAGSLVFLSRPARAHQRSRA